MSNLLVWDLAPGWLWQWKCTGLGAQFSFTLERTVSVTKEKGVGLPSFLELTLSYPKTLYNINLRQQLDFNLYLRTVDVEVRIVGYLCFLPAWSKVRKDTATVKKWYFVMVQIWVPCLTG